MTPRHGKYLTIFIHEHYNGQSTDPAPDNLVSLDISKCYPSILIDNESPIPLYTIHNIIKPFNRVFHSKDMTGEYYIDEHVINKRLGKGIKIDAGFYSEPFISALITKFKMPTSNIKWYIQARKTLALDTFKNYMLAIFSMFPESKAKLLANSYIGELGRKYCRKDHGFTWSSLDTAQCIWTSALAENRDVIIDSCHDDYVGNGAIYYGGAGCGKTYRLCQKAQAVDDPIILPFTNKAIQNVKSVLCDVYNNCELAKKCYTFDLFFCDHHGRDITALEGKTIFVDEYSMTPNKWMTKLYQAFTKY